MSQRDDKLLLKDILFGIDKIEMYVKGLSFDEFLEDVKTFDAVIRNIEIIGEASSRFSSAFRERYPELPYQEMKGMRNWLAHIYEGISYEIVWRTIEKDLPLLRTQIALILGNKFPE